MKPSRIGEESEFSELFHYMKEYLNNAKSRIHIYRPVHLLLAIILSIVSIFQFSERIELLIYAEKTQGQVSDITQEETKCDFSDGKNQLCTIFKTWITFQTLSGETVQFKNSWEQREKGHGKTIAFSNRKIGEKVNVIYHPQKPNQQSFENTFIEIWLGTIILTMFHLILFTGAFIRPKK